MLLGPILGLENDTFYSVIFASEQKYEEAELKLVLSSVDLSFKAKCSSVFELHSTWVYKFIFSVEPTVGNMEVNYEIQAFGTPILDQDGNKAWKFVVPGKESVPKIGFASCNGNGKKLPTPKDSADYIMWDKLYQSHLTEDEPYAFHCLILGGDQIYADPIWKSISYFKNHKLLSKRSSKKMMSHKISDKDRPELISQIEAFYENLYISSWSMPAVARVLSSIPSIMMWDDHDIFDGWGSQPSGLQKSEIFQLIFKIAKKYFEVFQIRGGSNTSRISKDHYTLQLRFRNFEIFALDNRSKRTSDVVMSSEQYDELNRYLSRELFVDAPEPLQREKVLLFAIAVPIAHLNYKERTEKVLKWQRHHNYRYSLNDDATDHWGHANHQVERERLLEYIYDLADHSNPKYVHIISGDVHSAGYGRIEKESDDGVRKINEFISSPIVYKPVGKFFQLMLSLLSDKKSDIEGYNIGIRPLGYGNKEAKVIYEKNFPCFFKEKNQGLRTFYTFEHQTETDQGHQGTLYFHPTELRDQLIS